MAKVYDALRRAEEERNRLIGDEENRPAPLQVEPAGPAVEREDRKPFWKRSADSLQTRQRPDGSAEINKRRISLLQPDSYVAEQFRALRGRIDALAAQRPIRTLAVSSPLAGEGKTTAAINLAAVTSMSVGRRVLLMDCDMRKPRIHQSLGLRPETGLAEVLSDQAPLDRAIIRIEGMSLDVLPVRGKPSNPSELLGSPRMRELIEEVAGRYDRVVIDTPAVLGVPDAKAVAELCDGIVMIVRAERTSQQDVEAALEILDRRRLLGLVLNGAQTSQGRYGYSS
jgi:capsular exopolysaccharide synthesis family protein